MYISAYCAATRKNHGIDECYKRLRQAGFEAVDWCPEKMWHTAQIKQAGRLPEDCILLKDFEQIKEYYRKEREIIQKTGLAVAQTHAPIVPYFQNNAKYEQDVLKMNINMIKLAAFLGAPYLVIHAPSNAADNKHFTFAEKKQAMLDRYIPLIPTIKETGVIVLLENTYNYPDHKFAGTRKLFSGGSYADVYEAIDHIDTLNGIAESECFGFCLDTGHLLLMKRRFRPYIDKLDSRLKALHLHDANALEDDHFLPYMGLCKWDELIDGLRAINYRGAINFEFDPEPYASDLYKVGKTFEKRILE